MKQHNQIGKRPQKIEILEAKKGRTFVTPKGREYIFDFEQVTPRKIHFIVVYGGKRWRMSESDFNRTPIDSIIDSIERAISDTENMQ